MIHANQFPNHLFPESLFANNSIEAINNVVTRKALLDRLKQEHILLEKTGISGFHKIELNK